MVPTALLEYLKTESSSLPVAGYRGAETVARFSDPKSELAALNSGCGVFDLGFWLRTELTGKDRVRWLNGMVTNNIRDLAVSQGVYAFVLNPQGQIQGDLCAYRLEDSILLDTDRAQAENTLAKLKRYIIMDDVKMNTLGDQVTAIGVSGANVREVLSRAGIAIPDTQPLQFFIPHCTCDCSCIECTVIRGEDSPQESYEIWIAPGEVAKVWKALTRAGATPVGAEAQELRRMIRGIPLYGADIHERELPQETEQERALSFTKGCYIGQEIVERIRSRGHVNRKFTGFVAEGAGQLNRGAKIVVDGKDTGEITSVTTLHDESRDRTLALGYIRREVATPGREVVIGDVKATVVDLPLISVPARPEVVAAR